MVFLVIALSAIGWVVATAGRYYLKLHRKGLIEVPTEMSDDFLLTDPNPAGYSEDDDQQGQKQSRKRYSKSQARFRLKKGKS